MLINYLPDFLKVIEDYKQLLSSLDVEINNLNGVMEYIVDQSSILKADEKRVSEWEGFLKISKQGDLYQRKLYIIATLTSVGKLNKTKIEEIVNIYTNGGGAIVEFKNSTIIVKVKPPSGSEDFLFPDIERTLNIMKPAHLGLSVIRYYITWGIVKEDFTTWQNLKDNIKTWQELKNRGSD